MSLERDEIGCKCEKETETETETKFSVTLVKLRIMEDCYTDTLLNHFANLYSGGTYIFASLMVGSYVPYSQLTLCAKWTYNVHNDRT